VRSERQAIFRARSNGSSCCAREIIGFLQTCLPNSSPRRTRETDVQSSILGSGILTSEVFGRTKG